MSGRLGSKQEERIKLQKTEINKKISQLNEKIVEYENKSEKQNFYLTQKFDEIAISKERIRESIDLESKSKKQITLHIETLNWLIESIDDSIATLKKSMITNIEENIKKNTKEFEDFINDLKEVMETLAEAREMEDEDELENIIFGITSTLEMLSENIDESIKIVSERVQKGTKEAVEDSGKEFDAFVEDIHQVFETFNTLLQKLKLTNSIKKYSDLEDIYSECNNVLDNYEEFSKKSADFHGKKQYYEEEINILEEFKSKQDKTTLEALRNRLQKKIDKTRKDLDNYHLKEEELRERLDIIEVERQNLRSFFEALSDEIVENQNVATETYNIMYKTLDNIHSTIPYIKNELKDNSNAAIFSIIGEFKKGIQTFGKIVDIIKKVQKIGNLKKKKQYIIKINKKSKSHLKKIENILPKLSKDVRKSNIRAINESFVEFDKFIEIFKKKFYIIEETVSAITLGTSERLIKDLQTFFDDQIEFRKKLIKIQSDIREKTIYLGHLENLIEDTNKKLDKYGEKEDRSHRKVIKYSKEIKNLEGTLEREITWKVENASVIGIKNVKISDCQKKRFEMSKTEESSPEVLAEDDDCYVKQWDMGSFQKREKRGVSYHLNGFIPIPKSTSLHKKHITPVKRYRYRNIANPLKLEIIERDGIGAILLQNKSEKTPVWNISLKFKPTRNIEELPNAKIISLNPLQTFIKKYTYEKPGSLQPYDFSALTQCKMGINLKRLKTIDQYNFEVFFENPTDFLVHLTSFQVYDPKNRDQPLVNVKPYNLETLRPNLDFRKTYKIETPYDPPEVMIDCEYTVKLVYEYLESELDLQELEETPNLLYKTRKEQKEKRRKEGRGEKPKGQKEKEKEEEKEKIIEIITSDPRIIGLDEDINKIEDIINDLNLRIKILQGKLKKKQKKRKKLVDEILKEHEIEREFKEKKKKTIRKQRQEIEQLKEEKKDLVKTQEKIDKLKERIKKRKIKVEKTSESEKISKNEKPKKKKLGEKAQKKRNIARKHTKKFTQEDQKKRTKKKGKVMKEGKKTKEEKKPDYEMGLVKVRSLKDADTVAIFMQTGANKIRRAIEEKDKRLKRKVPAFKELYGKRKSIQNRKLAYFDVEVIKQLKVILRNDIPKVKKKIIYRYFRGKIPEKENQPIRGPLDNVQKKKDKDKKSKKEKKRQRPQKKPKKPEKEVKDSFEMVKNKKDANITRFVCNNCAKNLKDALDQKDERLTRKADGFVRLFEMKDKIEDNKELNIDMDAGDQLEILLRQEGEDIKDKVKISYYKKIKKISKDKIEDFLDI